MEVVPHQSSIRINGNRQNNLTPKICQGAASLSFGPLGLVTCCHTQFSKEQNQANHICAQEVHTYVNEKVSETMLLYNVYIAILTLTSEYRETVTKLQAPFFSGTVDWWLRMPNTSERLLETPLPLYPSSE
jgi:hypothetical protein